MQESEINILSTRVAYKIAGILNDDNMRKFIAKKHVTQSEIESISSPASFRVLVSEKGLIPTRQDGRNTKKYYEAKKVLQLLELSYY